jgi:hypothetical protein
MPADPDPDFEDREAGLLKAFEAKYQLLAKRAPDLLEQLGPNPSEAQVDDAIRVTAGLPRPGGGAAAGISATGDGAPADGVTIALREGGKERAFTARPDLTLALVDSAGVVRASTTDGGLIVRALQGFAQGVRAKNMAVEETRKFFGAYLRAYGAQEAAPAPPAPRATAAPAPTAPQVLLVLNATLPASPPPGPLEVRIVGEPATEQTVERNERGDITKTVTRPV